MKVKKRTSCLYIKNIPANLKSYFKAYCAKREKTMSEIIIEFMKKVSQITYEIEREQRDKQNNE